MKKHLLYFLIASAFACTSCYTVNEPQPEGENEDEVYVNTLPTGSTTDINTGGNTNQGSSSILGSWNFTGEYYTQLGVVYETPAYTGVTRTFFNNGTFTDTAQSETSNGAYTISGSMITINEANIGQAITLHWKIQNNKLYIYHLFELGESGWVYTRVQ